MTETKTTPKTTAFMKELAPSPELAAIVGTQPLPRTEVTKRIWDYIKAHNLQNPANKRNILCDASLKAVIARFRTQRFIPSMLRRHGLPLAIAEIDCRPALRVIDLDDPAALVTRALRPSSVATRHRSVTQPQARAIYEDARQNDGIRWWSTYESAWMNITLFDRAGSKLRVTSVRALSVTDALVTEAAEFLGLVRT